MRRDSDQSRPAGLRDDRQRPAGEEQAAAALPAFRHVFLSHVVRAGDPVFPGDPPVGSARPPRSRWTASTCSRSSPASRPGPTGPRPRISRPARRPRTTLTPATSSSRRSCSTCGRRRRRTRISSSRPGPKEMGSGIRADPAGQRRHHVDGLRGPPGRPAGLPERGSRGRAARSGFRRPGRPVADRAARRPGPWGSTRWASIRVPTPHSAPTGGCSGSIACTWKPDRARRDAAGRRLDHRGRNADPGRLRLAGHRIRADPVERNPRTVESYSPDSARYDPR
jgi:hypothetical protein